MLDRRRLLLGAGAAALAPLAAAGPARAATVQPRRIPVELADRARALPAAAVVGAGRDVVFVEFFDYNCPWCRASAADLAEFLPRTGAGYRLVQYPILGEASVAAARIALGFLAQRGHEAYLAFHAALFAVRGHIDGDRALAVAADLGADPQAIRGAAALPGIDPALEDGLSVGRLAGLSATPSSIVGPFAYDGYLSPAEKLRIVSDLRG